MSFKASSFTLAGEGLLRQQVAQLAEKLRREGLMEPVAVKLEFGSLIDALNNGQVDIVCAGMSLSLIHI